MAKKTEEQSEQVVETPASSEQPVPSVDAPTPAAEVAKSPFDSVSSDKIEDYFSQIASYVEQVTNGSMKKDTSVYLTWRLLSEIK